MQIGSLRHRVTFQRATVTPNDYGEPVESWADIGTVWARIEPTTGKERFASLQVQSGVDHRIVCRYRHDLSTLGPSDRATWGNMIFDIKSVINPDQRNVELQIYAIRHI